MLFQQAERVPAGGHDLGLRVLKEAPVHTHAAPLQWHQQLRGRRRVVKQLRRDRCWRRPGRRALPACAGKLKESALLFGPRNGQ